MEWLAVGLIAWGVGLLLGDWLIESVDDAAARIIREAAERDSDGQP